MLLGLAALNPDGYIAERLIFQMLDPAKCGCRRDVRGDAGA